MLRTIIALNGVTSTTTSSPFSVEGATNISIQAYANNVTVAGSIGIEVSNDGTGWTWYQKLITNTPNTNSTNVTRTYGIPIATGGSTTYFSFDSNDVFRFVRLTANVPDNVGKCTAILGIREDNSF